MKCAHNHGQIRKSYCQHLSTDIVLWRRSYHCSEAHQFGVLLDGIRHCQLHLLQELGPGRCRRGDPLRLGRWEACAEGAAD
jgi:hypothetical protein